MSLDTKALDVLGACVFHHRVARAAFLSSPESEAKVAYACSVAALTSALSQVEVRCQFRHGKERRNLNAQPFLGPDGSLWIKITVVDELFRIISMVDIPLEFSSFIGSECSLILKSVSDADRQLQMFPESEDLG